MTLIVYTIIMYSINSTIFRRNISKIAQYYLSFPDFSYLNYLRPRSIQLFLHSYISLCTVMSSVLKKTPANYFKILPKINAKKKTEFKKMLCQQLTSDEIHSANFKWLVLVRQRKAIRRIGKRISMNIIKFLKRRISFYLSCFHSFIPLISAFPTIESFFIRCY